jgi:hypothetical protein
MAELWFSALTRGLLRRGEFTSRAGLAAKITDFAIRYNRTARPYTWTYDARADHARHLARHARHSDSAATRPTPGKHPPDGRVTPPGQQPNPSRINAVLH